MRKQVIISYLNSTLQMDMCLDNLPGVSPYTILSLYLNACEWLVHNQPKWLSLRHGECHNKVYLVNTPSILHGAWVGIGSHWLDIRSWLAQNRHLPPLLESV
jgi:hypothetical protein